MAFVERPAERVLDEAGLVLAGRQPPQLLEADAVFLRLALVEVVGLGELLGQRAARALGEQRVAAAQLHAAAEVGRGHAVPAEPHVAGGDAFDGAVRAGEDLGGGEAGIDVDAQRLGHGAEILGDVAERADEVAVVRQQLRHQHTRQRHPALLRQVEERVAGGLRLEWARLVRAPVRQQRVERAGVHDQARQDVGADLRGLLDHHHGRVGRELLQPDRRRKAGGTRADDHHVEVHALARLVGRLVSAHRRRNLFQNRCD